MKFKSNDVDIRSHFTDEHINNKELVKTMLSYEDTVIHGDIGKEIYADDSYEHFSTLEAMYTIHRIVLNSFNFKNTDDDIINYRKIFSRYYKSPFDYDEDVINCTHYSHSK